MRRAPYLAAILLLVSTGCVQNKKPETQPQPVAATPKTTKAVPPPQTAKAAPAPAAKAPASTTKATPAPATTAKTSPAPKGQPAPQTVKAPVTKPQPLAAPARPAAATARTLDLAALEAQLKQTKAIGLMTKITLKNQVNDLLDEFKDHHAGKPTPTVAELRRAYDGLMMKVLSLLQDRDQKLATDIVSSRERIWGLLADPKAFAALQV